MCLKTYFKIRFLYKKIGNIFYFKDDSKFLISFFEKINILDKLKQNLWIESFFDI